MRVRRVQKIPEALRRHNEQQQRDPEDVLSRLGRRVRVVVLWRQRDDDPERWIYLERMEPHEFSLETVKLRWGGGAYRIRLFGTWDRARRQDGSTADSLPLQRFELGCGIWQGIRDPTLTIQGLHG